MAKDIYHKVVREALIKDDWTITHDPYPIFYKAERIDYEIDLGAEKVIIAEKGLMKIAVEVKTFAKPSIINEFHTVLGQYLTYLAALKRFDPNRILFLAIPLYAEERLEDYPFIQSLIEEYHVNLIIFDWTNETILSWKS